MTDDQVIALRNLVKANEELQGARVIIDYAILLACEFAENDNYGLNDEMTQFVEKLYSKLK